MADISNIVFLDDSNWEDVANADEVAVLFFLVGHDLNCKRQIPHIVDFASRFGEKYTVGVIDGLKSPNAMKAFDVRKMPQMMITRNGIVLGGFKGIFTTDDESLAELIGHLDRFALA